MLLYLINPANRLVSISLNRRSYLNRYRLWKPLGLMTLAALTPSEWEVSILDENVAPVEYESLPRPDLVGITAFTSQAPRAYEIAEDFRSRDVPVVLGGIHATMCREEASRHVDSVVTGEAEPVWAEVLRDVRSGRLQSRYDGGRATIDQFVSARHEPTGRTGSAYAFGSLQTTRGCSLNCDFCSVTQFNGASYRQRAIAEVVEEFKSIPESRVLFVDDNLIGRKPQHIERAKDLFRALAEADTGKSWIGQTTINFADDEELLSLAEKAGCVGLFVGFESVAPENLPELGRKSEMLSGRDTRASVERIQRHNILVVGSFIMGLDSDRPGVGRLIAEAADSYGVDNMNVLFLTPLPGTRIWQQMSAEGRIAMNDFPSDWGYYTLNYPVARYKHLSRDEIVQEMNACNSTFYSTPKILARLGRNLVAGRNPLFPVVSNVTSRSNSMTFARVYEDLWPSETAREDRLSPKSWLGLVEAGQTSVELLLRLGTALRLQATRLFRYS